MQNIDPNDRYRIEKMLLIAVETGLSPTVYFEKHPPKPIIKELPVYEIDVDKTYLKERIRLRTHKMIEMGLIDEICYLEHRYTRAPNALKAIGIIEVFDYLDGRSSKEEMKEHIILHTSQLARRQQTFNRTQFPSRQLLRTEDIYTKASGFFLS